MHFTISPFGSAGDVFPFLGLALQLRERGHHVTFVTTGYFEEAVTRHGLEFIELGTHDEFLEAIDHPDLWNQRTGFVHIFRGIAAVFRRHYEILAERHRQSPTVAVSSLLGFGARIAQEKLRIPLVSVHLQPAVMLSREEPPTFTGLHLPRWLTNVALTLGERLVLDRVALPELNRFRAELSLPPIRRLMRWSFSTWCNLCMFPKWYAQPQSDWAAHVELADFPLWDDRADEPLPDEVASFLEGGKPLIVLTPGSANKFGASFFRAATEACRQVGQRALLLTKFPEQIPSDLDAEFRHFSFVPLARLLPQCAAVVHHGGIGTTSQGLAAGIPQLTMPWAHDQFDNSARVKRLGVGDWISKRRFQPHEVARRLHHLLDGDGVVEACRQISSRLIPGRGLSIAADVIEKATARLPSE